MRDTIQPDLQPGAPFSFDWNPDDVMLRVRLARLARQATSIGSVMSAPARAARNARFEAQARANFAAAYAKEQARNPGFHMTPPEQEREIERMRKALVSLRMTEMAHRRGDVQAVKANKRNKKTVGSSWQDEPTEATSNTARSRLVTVTEQIPSRPAE